MQQNWEQSSTRMMYHIDFLEKAIGYIPETISCRYNPGGLFKISNDIMDNPGDAKYGMTTEQLFEAFKILKAKGAKKFGIHAFWQQPVTMSTIRCCKKYCLKLL